MPTRRILAVICLLLGLASAAQAAHESLRSVGRAVKDPCLRHRGCRYHVEKAIILSGAELQAYALAEYQAAYAIRRTPWLLFNIARVLHRLNRLDEAIPYYQQYLDKAPESEKEQASKAQTYLLQAKQDVALSTVIKPPPLLAPIVITAPPLQRKPEPPIYKQPWLWTTVGILSVIVAVGITGGVIAATHGTPSQVPQGWPTFQPFQ